ncbi:Hypp4998 [Branchiostoma lanceolatum]|uniref:Hypp4998 protein n=1 Tax=Branchiostoma lanceolatum TaxID=7740 RepID=A0A8K0AHM9_BRALA|nr:Hypp4998 [Branchiostoma lanceolatum]
MSAHAAMEASCWELGARRPGRRLGNLRAQLRGDARPSNAMARQLMRARLSLGRHRTVTRSLCAARESPNVTARFLRYRASPSRGDFKQISGRRPISEEPRGAEGETARPSPRNPAVLKVRPPARSRIEPAMPSGHPGYEKLGRRQLPGSYQYHQARISYTDIRGGTDPDAKYAISSAKETADRVQTPLQDLVEDKPRMIRSGTYTTTQDALCRNLGSRTKTTAQGQKGRQVVEEL